MGKLEPSKGLFIHNPSCQKGEVTIGPAFISRRDGEGLYTRSVMELGLIIVLLISLHSFIICITYHKYIVLILDQSAL